MLERQIRELLPTKAERADDDDGTDPLADHRGERAFEFVEVADLDDVERHIQFSGGRVELREAKTSIVSLPESPHAGKLGDDLRRQTEVLGLDLGARTNSQAGDVSARPRQVRDEPRATGSNAPIMTMGIVAVARLAAARFGSRSRLPPAAPRRRAVRQEVPRRRTGSPCAGRGPCFSFPRKTAGKSTLDRLLCADSAIERLLSATSPHGCSGRLAPFSPCSYSNPSSFPTPHRVMRSLSNGLGVQHERQRRDGRPTIGANLEESGNQPVSPAIPSSYSTRIDATCEPWYRFGFECPQKETLTVGAFCFACTRFAVQLPVANAEKIIRYSRFVASYSA